MKLELFVGSLITPFHTPLPSLLEQWEGEQGLPFLLYINVRLLASSLPLASLVLSLLPWRYVINYNERRWGGGGREWHLCQCVFCHLKLYAKSHGRKIRRTCSDLAWLSHVLSVVRDFTSCLVGGEVWSSRSKCSTSICSRQLNVQLQLVWWEIWDLKSIMSDWNTRGFLWNVILCCALSTLDN